MAKTTKQQNSKPKQVTNGKSKFAKDDSKRAIRPNQAKTSFENCEGDNPAVGSKPNDVSWYTSNPELLKAGASFAYGYPLGSPAYLNNENYVDAGKLIVSGISAIDVIPHLGVSVDASSPLNQAVRKIYSFIRHANSGARNYDPADLGMYIGAMDQIYTMFWYGVRAYGTAQIYNPQNRYVPFALLEAQRFNAADVMKNLAKLRYGLNRIATIVNNLTVPDTMTLFKRHRWLFSGIYADGTSPKAQVYMLRPAGYFKFGLETGTYAGKLSYTSLYNSELFTVDSYLDLLDSMVKPILTNYDEDFGLIAGDIMKAYDVSQLYKLPAVPENYVVVPSYSEEVLSQIQNATLIGNYINNFNYTQEVDIHSPNAGAILNNPTVDVSMIVDTDNVDTNLEGLTNLKLKNFVSGCQNRLISLSLDNPTPEDTMVATRLTAMLGEPAMYEASPISGTKSIQITAKNVPILTAGTEFATRLHIYKVEGYGENYNISELEMDMDAYIPKVTEELLTEGGSVASMTIHDAGIDKYLSISVRNSHFRYHPMLVATRMNLRLVVNANKKLNNVRITDISNFYNFEIDNYTVLDKNNLSQLNEIAVLALLNI